MREWLERPELRAAPDESRNSPDFAVLVAARSQIGLGHTAPALTHSDSTATSASLSLLPIGMRCLGSVLTNELHEQTFVGIAGYDSRTFAATLRDRLGTIETEPTHGGISVAAVAIGGETAVESWIRKSPAM